jgi:hypothetical protein
MRRALALLLLAVIGSPLLTPLLLAGARAELPTCCRRDGKHHCAMGGVAGTASPEAPSLKRFQPKCPFFPKPGALPADLRFVIVVGPIIVSPADLVRQQVNPSISTPPLIGSRGAERMRGPPPLIS